MLIHFALFSVAILSIWFGAGLIIRGVDELSRKLKISSFAVSFFVLGILTSVPELSVGLSALADQDPEIYVGNLLGGVIVLFLFVIPMLAIVGNGIQMTKQLDKSHTILALFVIAAPAMLIFDRRITYFDGIIMIFLYFLLLIMMQKKKGIIEAVENGTLAHSVNYRARLTEIFAGAVIVFFASQYVVDQTLLIAADLDVSPFYISLLAISFGTNMPELSLMVRSVTIGKKDVALGDYIGSAAANTLLFGVFSIMYPTAININGNFSITFISIMIGLMLFYVFSRSRNEISRFEGLFLLALYIAFVVFEIFKAH